MAAVEGWRGIRTEWVVWKAIEDVELKQRREKDNVACQKRHTCKHNEIMKTTALLTSQASNLNDMLSQRICFHSFTRIHSLYATLFLYSSFFSFWWVAVLLQIIIKFCHSFPSKQDEDVAESEYRNWKGKFLIQCRIGVPGRAKDNRKKCYTVLFGRKLLNQLSNLREDN